MAVLGMDMDMDMDMEGVLAKADTNECNRIHDGPHGEYRRQNMPLAAGAGKTITLVAEKR